LFIVYHFSDATNGALFGLCTILFLSILSSVSADGMWHIDRTYCYTFLLSDSLSVQNPSDVIVTRVFNSGRFFVCYREEGIVSCLLVYHKLGVLVDNAQHVTATIHVCVLSHYCFYEKLIGRLWTVTKAFGLLLTAN